MFIAGMELFMLLTTILPCLCLGGVGADVELTASPSPVTEGGSLTLTCSMTGNNDVYSAFFYVNGTYFGFVQRSVEGKCKDVKERIMCTQQCSCAPDGKSFSMTIPSVTRSWGTSRVRCRFYNPTSALSDILEISVICTYPPNGTLSMTPSGTQSFVTGTSVTLLCQVGGGKPLATLTWQCKGSALAGLDLTNATTAMSSLTVNVDETYHQQRCVCTASQHTSPIVQLGTVNVMFDVRYPPNGILTMTPSGTQSVVTGTSVTLLCQVGGGNPLATLTWQCKRSSLAGLDLTNATTAMSSLTVTVDETYHQQRCVCTARQQTSPSVQLGSTVEVVFDVIDLDISTKYDVTIDANIFKGTSEIITSTFTTKSDLDSSTNDGVTVYASNVEGTSEIIASTLKTTSAADLDILTNDDVTVYASNVKGTSEIIDTTFKTRAVADLDISTNDDATVYTTNVEGTSEIIASTLKTTSAKLSGGKAAIIGGATGPAAAVVLTIGVVILIFRHKRHPPSAPQPAEDEHLYDEIGLEHVGNPVEEDVVTDQRGQHLYDEINLELVGIPIQYEDVVTDNEGRVSGESSNPYLLMKRRSEESKYVDVSLRQGTGQDSGYVNTSLH